MDSKHYPKIQNLVEEEITEEEIEDTSIEEEIDVLQDLAV
jgi:hypothetical protein